MWGHWIDGLSSGFTLVRYDGRLNGLSDTICQDISFEAFVDDLERVVEAVGLDRFVLLGISQGCALSTEYALRHPEKVAGLVIVGGYVRGWRARGNAAEIARREAISVLMREGWGQDDPLFRQIFPGLFIPGANRLQMDWFNELQRRTLTPDNAFRLNFAFADIDISRSLERLNVPALVLHASGDRVAPLSEGLEVARTIAGARFVELDSANHILLAEEPAFRSFIAEVSAFANAALQGRAAVPADPRTRRQATILSADFRHADQVDGCPVAPRPRMKRPFEAACRSHAICARFIGLRERHRDARAQLDPLLCSAPRGAAGRTDRGTSPPSRSRRTPAPRAPWPPRLPRRGIPHSSRPACHQFPHRPS